MPDWGSLPDFRVGSRVRKLAQNWDEFATEYGPPLTSKRGTAAEKPVTAEIVCETADLQNLEQFYEISCDEGVTHFTKDGKTYRWAEPPDFTDFLTYGVVRVALMQQPT